MEGISIYLLSIVGVVMLFVVIELVLPEGQLAKYVKSIMSVVLIFVIASPLPSLLKNGINFSFDTSADLNESYLETVQSQSLRALENSLTEDLEENGILNAEVQVWGELENGAIKISYIFVEMGNVVLTGDMAHINKNEAVINVLIDKTNIKEEQIVLNG